MGEASGRPRRASSKRRTQSKTSKSVKGTSKTKSSVG
ncbi:hypothetical protein IEO21_09529 [Rhodonia placenta]|uniref:Uncharacterized protein n=1 Tax=Rhodonia placenta TaxID=104341 RepID=A0A8H7TYD6_9APHY|nr:hypothetical protein IEO21_09529 [Postia placenta]